MGYLGSNSLEDEDIMELVNLKSLKRVNLSKNKISGEGVNKLKKKMKEKI